MIRSIFVVWVLVFLKCFDVNSQGFTVSGTKLLDANGKEFIIKGVNVPAIWYIEKSNESLKNIADLKTNCVRIVWSTEGKADQLEKIIQQCVQLEMIPMVELHDATGSPKAEKLLETVDYYTTTEVKKVLLKYEKYILINLVNEWGNFSTTLDYWKDAYMKAISRLRDAGIHTTLVIDATNWGQNYQSVLQYGKTLLDHDPYKNILFSVHMYYFWNNPKVVEKGLQELHDASLPLVVGEFGYNFKNGDNNLKCTVDHTVVLRKCIELGYGYMPWAWAGNNNENAWLDLSDWTKLTWWGKEVFEGPNGITATAKKASVFEKK
jgi:mannan endo-1,4-beta-mannosidase